jgi:signal transduction histidine kinase
MSPADIRVVKELAPDMPQAWIDRNKIKQVLVNVFTNAIHAMPDGGTLTLRTQARELRRHEIDPDFGSRIADRFREGDRVAVLEVLDTGRGISSEKLSRIFDPFFTTKPTGKGTGLGLTVTKKIVELHGGTLDVRNRKEGGVLVTVVLKL